MSYPEGQTAHRVLIPTAPAIISGESILTDPPLISSIDAVEGLEAVAQQIADHAVMALLAELATWPKPGLVSHVDNGSHRDMTAAMLTDSAHCLRPFFAELAFAGGCNADMKRLRAIGIRAEQRMLDVTGGVNTHRGAIFGLGLLCSAAGLKYHLSDTGRSLGQHVAMRWGNAIVEDATSVETHGSRVLRRYGAGGARHEAASGFPSLYRIGLPALREGKRMCPSSPGAASVHACMALIAEVEDTNVLHRGGVKGAQFARQCAWEFLAAGGIAQPDWIAQAADIHRAFVMRHLSPGGCADLLAMTHFVLMFEQQGSTDPV